MLYSSLRVSNRTVAPLLISLLAFVIGVNGWIAAPTAVAHEVVPTSAEMSTLIGTLLAEADTAASAERNECASVAYFRWLPHDTLNIGYARGDFTDKERAAFHKAVRSWQQALAQTNVGIVLNEIGEIDKDAVPAQSQIIVKRDDSMDEGHYGKFVAAARRDNYFESALILIKGSLHKQDPLRKTLLHELGHAFGLGDCPDCRSGATVMNYFSQLAIMGIKVRGAGSKIAKQPTAGDISQVLSGYRQSQPPTFEKAADESEDTRTIVGKAALDPNNRDDGVNIIAPYLKLASETEARTPGGVPFVKLSWKQDTGKLSFPGRASEREPSPLAIFPFPKPVWKRVGSSFSLASILGPVSEKQAKPPAIAPVLKPNLENAPRTLVAVSTPESASVREAETAIDQRARESVLTDAERKEFELYVPTLLETEAQTMKELNSYTFRREVRIQTLDSKGRVSGEYHRISDMLFDDSGGRIERGVWSSNPTLRKLKISPEYVEDFSGAQLKGFELSKHDHYRIEPFMTDTTDGVRMRVYRMTPLNLNAERAAHARVFYGFVWIDEKTGKIVKLRGCALPDDKQRFPLFETQRALIDGMHLFPARTIADDYLVFPSHKVHVRMLITYTNYKKFASRVSITEVEDR